MLARTPYTLILLRTIQAQADDAARRELARERDAKSRKVRLLNRDRRRHLIETAAAILRTGQPTHFALEGSCRHGIRRSLCLEGWPWQDADLAAADVVSAALNQIGAVRPTWQQGQLGYADDGAVERMHCINCARPVAISEDGRPRKYCSAECMGQYHARMASRFGFQQSRAEYLAACAAERARRDNAQRDCERCGKMFRQGKNKDRTYCDECVGAVRSEANRKHEDRACLQCGAMFQPTHADAKFCGRECMAKAFSGDRRAPRSCEQCGVTFAPKKGGDQRYCSHDCYAKGKAKKTHAARPCDVCETMFTPAFPHAIYCTKLCQSRFERAKKAAALPPKQCENCQTYFRSERAVARFCGTSCSAIARNRAIREASAFRCEAAE